MFEASVITINETEKRNKINSNSFYKNTWCQTQQTSTCAKLESAATWRI